MAPRGESERLKITLDSLRAELYGKPVELEVIVSGQSPAKNLPRTLVAVTRRGGVKIDFKEIDLTREENFQYLRDYLFEPGALKQALLEKAGRVEMIEEGRMDYQVLICRDLPDVARREQAVYATVPVYLVGQKAPPDRKVRISGRVVDDKERNLVVLAYSCRPMDERREMSFGDADHEQFERYLRTADVERTIDETICPYIVGRADAKLAAALTLCSPAAFDFEGRRIRGNLHTMFCGDSTVGKSSVLKWIRDELRLGEFGVGDMSSYAGLLAAVDTEHDAIIWGLLPLADREVALIDSFQKLSTEDVPMFREALRDERLTVRKKVSGEAMCRVRVLAAANPRRTLDGYVVAAEALRDIASITDPVDLTRWDIFVKFYARDVADERIAEAAARKPRIPVEVFRKFVLWVWTLEPEDVEFTDAAVDLVRHKFVEFSELYCSELPLVHKGYKETIARVAAAFAALTYSVRRDGSRVKVVVREEHVERACNFLRRLMESWELRQFVENVMRAAKLEKEEVDEIKAALQDNPDASRAFDAIVCSQGVEAETLAAKLGISRSAAVKAVALLKSFELVETQRKRPGYWLTPRGVAFAKLFGSVPETPKLSQEDRIARVMEIVDELDEGEGAPIERVVEKAANEGIAPGFVEHVIEQSKRRGLLFEPKLGRIARVKR
jgi:hypothetical protein